MSCKKGDVMKKSLFLATLFATLLSACSALPSQRWQGQSEDTQGIRPLSLEVRRVGNTLEGSYMVGSSQGSFEGVLEGDSLTATLTPTLSCSYSFSGTLTENSLTGNYEPTACPGGSAGSWDLERD